MKAMTRPMKKERKRHDRQRVEARLLHHCNHRGPADAARIDDQAAHGRHRLADEGQRAEEFAPGLDGAVAGAVEQRNDAGRADRIGRRGGAGLAHLAEQALDLGVLAADLDRIVDAFERAERPVDQVGARRVDAAEFADIQNGVIADLGVAKLFFDTGDSPDGPLARDGKNLSSIGGGIHLKSCRVERHLQVLQ